MSLKRPQQVTDEDSSRTVCKYGLRQVMGNKKLSKHFATLPESETQCFHLSSFGAPQLTRHVPFDAAFVCDKAAVLCSRHKLKQTVGIT